MREILSLFFVGLFLIGFSQKEEKQTDLEKENLKGKVKSVTETQYRSVEKFGELQKGNLYEKYTFKYDYKGNKTEFADYNSDGSLRDKRTFKYEYDSKGNWTKRVSYLTQSEITKPYQIAEREIEYYD